MINSGGRVDRQAIDDELSGDGLFLDMGMMAGGNIHRRGRHQRRKPESCQDGAARYFPFVELHSSFTFKNRTEIPKFTSLTRLGKLAQFCVAGNGPLFDGVLAFSWRQAQIPAEVGAPCHCSSGADAP